MSDFVCCINNDSNLASLIVGKVYRTLPDVEAEAHNKLRIIDEAKSEPDGYRYPAAMFAPTSPPEVLVHCVHGTHPRGKWQQLLWNAKYAFRWLLTPGKPCTPAFPVPHGNREKRCWFEPDSKFEDAVLKKLKDLGSDSCRVRFERFLWSGSNSFRARDCAAQELRRYLAKWHRELPRAKHLILAHSHGGTVAATAVDTTDELAEPPAAYGDEPLPRVKAVDRIDKPVKGMMTLGTPFVRLVKRRPKGVPSRLYEAVGVSLPVISLLGALLLVIDVLQHATAASTTMWGRALLLLAFLALVLRHVGLAAVVLVMVCFVGGYVVLTHLMFLGTIFVIGMYLLPRHFARRSASWRVPRPSGAPRSQELTPSRCLSLSRSVK